MIIRDGTLRQKNFPDAIVIQCRIEFTPTDIFRAILANLDISLEVSSSETRDARMELRGEGEYGWSLLGKIKASIGTELSDTENSKYEPIGRDVNDLEFVCAVIRESGRRVVIEDFHYLSGDAQRNLAHDLKAMWDFGIYVVIIGVWVKQNYLTYLNPDLAGRIREISIYWSHDDLREVVSKGCSHLKITISKQILDQIVIDSFGNVGLLQSLTIETLDEADIHQKSHRVQECTDIRFFEDAALSYAEQLEAVFLEFARRTSSGIRSRRGSTGIYAHTMWAVFDSEDDELIKGVNVNTIFDRASARQPRIQKANLRSILPRIDELQIDDRGKGLVVTFVEQSESVAVVDRSVLFYRKYSTINWPWHEIANAAADNEMGEHQG